MKIFLAPLLQRAFKFRGAALLKLSQDGDVVQRVEQLV
jgi:hypothetical protein